MTSRVVSNLSLLRPKQWVKNGFIFVPILFAGTLTDARVVWHGVFAFVCFCGVSSAMYLINDMIDAPADRLHPQKRFRPIAAGTVKPGGAAVTSAILLCVGLAGASLISRVVVGLLTVYVVMNVLYFAYGKSIVLIDVFFLASGFVLRILVGSFVSTVPPTPWLVLMAFFLSLFLGFAKRKAELAMLGDQASQHRSVLASYSGRILDQFLMVLISMVLLTYSMYTVSDHVVERFGTNALVYTVPLVVYGLFRYLYLVHHHETGGDPTELLLTDKPLMAVVVLWGFSCFLIIQGWLIARP